IGNTVYLLRRFAGGLAILGLAAAPAAGATLARGETVSERVIVPFDAEPLGELLAALNEARHQASLPPLAEDPALTRVAAQRASEAARSGDLDGTPSMAMTLTRDLRRAGYAPYAWRQRMVQGPRDAAALVRQWRS